ncbi:MAG: transcription termination/antitermination NusG family protein, partial [Lentisphaeria bacterium]|nr:transcription termination/antitermination NusG family protein [Lentisphaeria bacterium]
MPGLSDPTAGASELRIKLLADRRWIVVRTMARCEKKFAKFCDHLDIRHYLPLRRSVKRYTRKVATHLVPIFPGYVFVQVNPNLKPELLASKLTARV